MPEFKNIIVKLRKEKGYSTQEEFAKAIGMSRSTIGMWESGVRFPSKEGMEQLADFFNVDIDYLYGRSKVRQYVHFDGDGNPMYYIDVETARVAQEIFEKDKILFDVYNSVDKDRLIEYAKRLMALRKMEEGDE